MPVQVMNQQQKKYHPVQEKMNAEEDGLTQEERYQLVCTDSQVQGHIGQEPIPQLDILVDEIQNELQIKMVQEIQCAVCQQFPYKPLQCNSCNKLFCKYCQLQLGKGDVDQYNNVDDQQTNLGNIGQKMDQNMMSQGREGKDIAQRQPTQMRPCPCCNAQGDYMGQVNAIVKNCIDFCEFPHKCPGKSNEEIIWKTLSELQAHAQFHCPKFSCNICQLPEFQFMTRVQLYDHIKYDCPKIKIQCQVCNKDYFRDEFHRHQCIKDFYLDKLNACETQVIDHLADKLILAERQREGLGVCARDQCEEKHRNSGKSLNMAMIVQNTESIAVKCLKCQKVVAASEDSYSCIYCRENYCSSCIGYCKFYDLEEMEKLLASLIDSPYMQ